MGPALHCGVFVISQCKHFRTGWAGASEFAAAGFAGRVILIFLLFFIGEDDSAKLSDSDETRWWAEATRGFSTDEEEGEMSWITGLGLKVAGRGRLLRARCGPRWRGLIGTVFPPEEELLLLLLLSTTETGLEVWNWLCGESLVTRRFSFPTVSPPPEKESSTKVDSHSNWTISSYCNSKHNQMKVWRNVINQG